MLLRLLPGLLVHRIIPSNTVLLFRVFMVVVTVAAMATLLRVPLENLILRPRHLQFIRKDLISSLLQTTLEVIQRVYRKQLSLQQKRKR